MSALTNFEVRKLTVAASDRRLVDSNNPIIQPLIFEKKNIQFTVNYVIYFISTINHSFRIYAYQCFQILCRNRAIHRKLQFPNHPQPLHVPSPCIVLTRQAL